ncbi:MAG: transcription elongation factor GreAB [Verrucomicrobiota bacterium]
MTKEELLKEIIRQLEAELEHATQVATETAESATDDESRQEGKYDTRGLEASYVASAQANFVKDLRESLAALNSLHLRPFTSSDPIAISALVTTLSSTGREQFFIAPAHGGLEIETETGPIMLITPHSPLGADLIGKIAGHKVTAAGGKSILKVE